MFNIKSFKMRYVSTNPEKVKFKLFGKYAKGENGQKECVLYFQHEMSVLSTKMGLQSNATFYT